jgi:anaphase-promoting complex subunit 5
MLWQQQVGQASTAVEQLLRALWHSEFQCRYGSYRTAIILLADVGLEFGMTKRCKRILEEIMPQVNRLFMRRRTSFNALV